MPSGDPNDPDDGDDGFSDSDDPWAAERHQWLLRRGRTSGGRDDRTTLKLPDKFAFPKLPGTAAGISRWFAVVGQKLGPY